MVLNFGLLTLLAWLGLECHALSDKFITALGSSVFDNKMCPADQVAVQTVAMSAASCSLLCSRTPGCVGVIYLHDNGTCVGVRTGNPFVVASSPLPGAVFFRKQDAGYYGEDCSATLPCIEAQTTCFPGLEQCVCDPLTSNYNEATGTCTQGCAQFSSNFQVYPDRVTWGLDKELQAGQTDVTACLQYCIQVTNYTCQSVDWENGRTCFYADRHISTNPSVFREWGAYVYVRNCLN